MDKGSRLLVSLSLLLAAMAVSAQDRIPPEQAVQHVGKTAQVCGKIESGRYAENTSGQPTFLHLGAAFPKHSFQVRIDGKNREKFTTPPETLVGFVICVRGKIVKSGATRAEMEIDSPNSMLME